MKKCNFCSDFKKSIRYVSPAHGGWGVIRVAALVPESHLLFVAPFACGRHGALGGLESGIKERISYLFIDESDIVSGNYEQLIPNAVHELFDFISNRPKVLFIFVSCLDDLLGTDHEAVNAELSASYPDVQFRTCHMNPFAMDTPNPPGVTLLDAMYSLLEKKTTEKKILLVGNNVPVSDDCDVIQLLNGIGYEVGQIGNCTRYDQFSELSGSCLNLLLRSAAKKACKSMESRLGIPFMESWCDYDVDRISAWYRKLAEKLGVDQFKTDVWYRKAVEAIEQTHDVLGTVPIAIDYQAVLRPFSLARALLKYDFNVQLIAVDECLDIDRESEEWIEKRYPDISIVNAMHPDMLKFKLRGDDYLCIGFDSGYMTGSSHTVNLMDDEGLFGFYGVIRLMEMLRDAINVKDLRLLIEEAKLVI